MNGDRADVPAHLAPGIPYKRPETPSHAPPLPAHRAPRRRRRDPRRWPRPARSAVQAQPTRRRRCQPRSWTCTPPTRTRRRRRCCRAAASGACRACSSTSAASSASSSGYSGGAANTANYETVSDGGTGHAESVQITYDPAQISYGQLLRIFFSVALDPTEVNRQGPDSGTQYRSEVFYADAGAGEDRPRLHRAARPGARLRPADRDARRSADRLLPGRGLPSGLSDPAPEQPVHRHQRPAQGARPAAPISQQLRRAAGPRVAVRGLNLPRRGHTSSNACCRKRLRRRGGP